MSADGPSREPSPVTGESLEALRARIDAIDHEVLGLLARRNAVVAEVAEGWTTSLDTRMEELGGTVFRRYRIDVEDNQIEREIDATNRELDELEAEWDQAVGETKDKLKAKVDAARTKLSDLNDKANKKLDSLKAEADAKIAKMDEQIGKAKDE